MAATNVLILVLVIFAFVFLLVLAFSSSKKQTRVRKIDPTTGQETIEIHETNTPSPAQTAARGIMWIIGIGIVLLILVNQQ